MKKFILPLVAVGFIFAGTSCKKDYTCECNYDDGAGTTASASYTYTNVKKKDAESACENADGGVSDWKCELK